MKEQETKEKKESTREQLSKLGIDKTGSFETSKADPLKDTRKIRLPRRKK